MNNESRDNEDFIRRFGDLTSTFEKTGEDMFEVYRDAGIRTGGQPDRHARVLAEMVLHMEDTLTAAKQRIRELQELAARIRKE